MGENLFSLCFQQRTNIQNQQGTQISKKKTVPSKSGLRIWIDNSQRNYAEWKKPVSKDSFYIVFLKWQNCREEEQISGCQGLGTIRGIEVTVAIEVWHEGSLW